MRRMVVILLAIFLALSVVVPAWAVGPVASPQKCEAEWGAPTLNADGSPLTDLAKYNIYISPVPDSFSATPFASVPSTVAAPPAGTIVKWDCRTAGISDGQHYLTVRAVDTALNEGANAVLDPAVGGTQVNGAPFLFNGVKPGSATGLKFSP